MFNTIKVNYTHTNSAYKANKMLAKIAAYDEFAWDLEVASKYSDTELELYKEVIGNTDYLKSDRIIAQSRLNATALDHPSHCYVTHCSIAVSESEGYVFILDNQAIHSLVFNFLVTTKQLQILHNSSFDFKHLYYHTGKFPINYEDTALLVKCLTNHVDTWKAGTKLKDLAGHWYGDWGLSSDNFTLDQMYEESMLKYSATDSCATLKLWSYCNDKCDEIDKEIIIEFNKNDPPPDWM